MGGIESTTHLGVGRKALTGSVTRCKGSVKSCVPGGDESHLRQYLQKARNRRCESHDARGRQRGIFVFGRTRTKWGQV